MSTHPASLALALAALLVGSGTAFAGPAVPADARAVTKVAEVGSALRPAAEGEDETGTCSRNRRRLWVEGEGWVVRRITTCR